MKADYPLYDHWFKATDWILDKCDRMPKHTRFTIAGRIANHTLDTLELLTDAVYSSQKKATLTQVNLKLEKLRLLFRLCFERQYISMNQYEFVQLQINTAGRMVGGWLKSCKE
ncbi:diversity-generating retroelement protein Avd [Haliscomenobacter sp.]|uniref:diversity-generating retroelement protein Avd n=1 Tax=Haliscomenobacter sp. TaxID=2717303 RepID=UPI003364CF48